MLEKIEVTKEKLYTFHGIFDLCDAYDFVKGYVEDAIYYYDVTEKDYEEVNDSGKRKIMSKLEATKIYNDYFKIVMKFELLMEGKNTEVEVNGQKKMLTKGIAKLKINSYVHPDWNNDRSSSPFASFLGTLHDKFVGNDELGTCIEHAAIDVGKLIANFKQHMGAGIK